MKKIKSIKKMNSKTASLALFFVFCLAGVSKSTPLAYETISLEPGIQSRAAWCQNVFGVQGFFARTVFDKDYNIKNYSFYFINSLS